MTAATADSLDQEPEVDFDYAEHVKRLRGDMPTLLTLDDMVKLFPVSKQAVYRWNSFREGRKKQLPEPLLVLAGKPLWDEETVIAFGKRKHLKADRNVLRRIRRSQGKAA